MYRFRLYIIGMIVVFNLTACSNSDENSKIDIKSGIELKNMDTTVRPQDDFYTYVNGTWIEETEIPSDKSSVNAFTEVYDKTQLQLKEIIEDASQNESTSVNSDEKKIGDLYTSYMDEGTIESADITPLQDILDLIATTDSRTDLVALMAELYIKNGVIPFSWDISSDDKNSTQNILYLYQSGLGLPNREYYLDNNGTFTNIRTKYQTFISDLMTMSGYENSEQIAKDIFNLENRLAQAQWSSQENRDITKTYNKYSSNELSILMGSFDMNSFLEKSKLENASEFIVMQPSYLEEFSKIFEETSVSTWKEYLAFHFIQNYANLLSKKFVDLNFEFYGRTIDGIEEQTPRWKDAVNSVNELLGEMLGKVYVEKYFPPEAKERMDILVQNLIKSFDLSMDTLEWMGSETKLAAKEKLGKISTKIGYPDRWKDYSSLEISADDLVGNYMRYYQWYYTNLRNKLNKPVDRSQWYMSPQEVNAYYNPSGNEVVFPAAILQPPFFNMQADDAINYGAIGAVIGHELSHAFDDMGSKYDGDGNLHNWMSEADSKKFKELTEKLVTQYSVYEPLEGHYINGELTLGENIADLNGVNIAYKAYMLSLNDEEGTVMDNYSAKQRFFIGWAQIWRGKMKEEEILKRLITDPHSPKKYRVFGVLSNVPGFYEAFDVGLGDAMYREPDQRIKIW